MKCPFNHLDTDFDIESLAMHLLDHDPYLVALLLAKITHNMVERAKPK